MRAYLITTAVLFALVTVVHGWRVVEESRDLARDPWFLVISLCALALCVWAIVLLRRLRRVI